jgi:hypothetical protein
VYLCSSEDTRSRAKRLAKEIGSFHLNVPIDSIVSAFLSLFESLTGKRPRYKVLSLNVFTFHQNFCCNARLLIRIKEETVDLAVGVRNGNSDGR